MAMIHNLGFPRMGPERELKFALEKYWKGERSEAELEAVAADLRRRAWSAQQRLAFVPVGDFSLYDHVLDTSAWLGNLPARAAERPGSELDRYFRIARGRSAADKDGYGVNAGEMTKWFDTNYHYIVPEFTKDTHFELNPGQLAKQIEEAKAAGYRVKPVLLGPVTYLALGKSKDGSDKLALLPRLLPAYEALLSELSAQDLDWVQLDEPILATDLPAAWSQALRESYQRLGSRGPRVLLASYFGAVADNLPLALQLDVSGLHLDAVRGRDDVKLLEEQRLAGLSDKVLSLGVIDGRNVWKSDLVALLDRLEPLHEQLGDRLWLAPSCSLLHAPVDVERERALDPEIRSWLAFALQKLEELHLLGVALNEGRSAVEAELVNNRACIDGRHQSARVHRPEVRAQIEAVTGAMQARSNPYEQRSKQQRARLKLPLFPTTTIGSFPQTLEIRRARRDLRAGRIDEARYRTLMREAIAHAVREQETLDLDVLVHGEAERNDMVEYFGEQLEGFAFTEHGWVQSYGSRCVKPPILYGDVERPKPMTVGWTTYAQSLTKRPMKGMLTGPVTILNWSFVRDDQPRSLTCQQLALAVRKEVLDLERAGTQIIQIDEAALREGLPLRRSQWPEYLSWAVGCFKLASSGVGDETQIHTHMCYSEFNDIIEWIAEMDADVITIETSRSDMELLDAFESFQYPNEIGPGVYDIHSPNVPSEEQVIALLEKASQRIPPERLWVNPDCGLKTRGWAEVVPALRNMVAAAKTLRGRYASPKRARRGA